jgi:phosphoribosylanthranilate isomerase
MWIKICANTNLVDALLAAELGADAVGFVFARSVRQVGVEQVRQITDQLPPSVERVGVFAGGELGADPAMVADAAVEAGLDTVQMHGGLDLEWAAELREQMGPAISVIHTVHWQVGEDEAAEREVRAQLRELAGAGLGERVLIDAKIGSASGGLGVRFDWRRAKAVLDEAAAGLEVIVAGGLRPENVAEAVQTLRPYGVDVASGVERRPGQKDADRLKAFIENARRA